MKLKFSDKLPDKEGWWFATTQVIYADKKNIDTNGCVHSEYINIEDGIPYFVFWGDDNGFLFDQRIDCGRLKCKWAGPVEFEF